MIYILYFSMPNYFHPPQSTIIIISLITVSQEDVNFYK